jgi:hypothetical protein
MLGHFRRSGNRQFIAALLIFALKLQGVALAVAVGRLVAKPTGDVNWAGFEICYHSHSADAAGNAAAPGRAPEHSDIYCCIFCLAGATHLLEAPLLSTEFRVIIRAIVPENFTAWRLPALTIYASARPRGPPAAA